MEQSTLKFGLAMTDMVFNELSIYPLAVDKTGSYNRIKTFISTFKKGKEFDFNKIRFDDAFDQISLSVDYTLNDFCNDNHTIGVLLRGLARYPFIDDNSDEEKRYIESKFLIRKNGAKKKTCGLAAAYLYSTIGIGYLSDEYWGNFEHLLEIEGDEKGLTTVLCASKREHFETDVFGRWIDANTEVILIKCHLSVAEKKIALRDDHGKDKLMSFSKKILKSPYVISVINSLPYNSAERNFIRKVYPTGNIEIVLTDTDMGLGLVVKTTGRNLRETKTISEVLKNNYA